MPEIFGAFQDCTDAADALESLLLRFSPSLLPLRQRWRNNGLSADFLADYVTTFFPKDEDDPASAERQSAVRGAVSYIANELLENAMKYSDGSGHPITIRLMLHPDRVVFEEINAVTPDCAANYRRFIGELLGNDPSDLYFQRLEEVAVTGDASGLGLITMITDYGAALSWRFGQDAEGTELATTQVCVAV